MQISKIQFYYDTNTVLQYFLHHIFGIVEIKLQKIEILESTVLIFHLKINMALNYLNLKTLH